MAYKKWVFRVKSGEVVEVGPCEKKTDALVELAKAVGVNSGRRTTRGSFLTLAYKLRPKLISVSSSLTRINRNFLPGLD